MLRRECGAAVICRHHVPCKEQRGGGCVKVHHKNNPAGSRVCHGHKSHVILCLGSTCAWILSFCSRTSSPYTLPNTWQANGALRKARSQTKRRDPETEVLRARECVMRARLLSIFNCGGKMKGRSQCAKKKKLLSKMRERFQTRHFHKSPMVQLSTNVIHEACVVDKDKYAFRIINRVHFHALKNPVTCAYPLFFFLFLFRLLFFSISLLLHFSHSSLNLSQQTYTLVDSFSCFFFNPTPWRFFLFLLVSLYSRSSSSCIP